MSSIKKCRWLLLLLIWSGVLILTYANAQTISRILTDREKREMLRSDREFWKRHSTNISKILRQRTLLHQEIDSLKLGVMSLNETINGLGSRFGLSEIKVDMDPEQSQGERIPVNLSFKGPLLDGMGFLNAIQTEYSFLPIQKIRILFEPKGNQVRFDTFLFYQYQIVASSQMPDEH